MKCKKIFTSRMKIKNRILLYNTLMVILSLTALLVIGSFVISLWGSSDQSGEPDNMSEKAQDLMNSLDESSSLKDADRQFSELGYSFYVFSSPGYISSPGDEELSAVLTPRSSGIAKMFSLSENIFIVRRVSPNVFLAVKENPENPGSSLRGLMIAFIVVGSISVIVIIAISYIFTRNLLKHISKPLADLAEGAGRVESGDLSEPINYDGSDEFKAVCDSFDRMQQHLKSERDKNAAYEKARTDLISGISHDLRTPLTSVKGYIKGIRDGVANTPEKRERYLKTAYLKANEMDVLLQRLFFFSRMETGNLPLSKKTVDLALLLSYYVDESALDPHLQHIVFETAFEEGPFFSDVDAQQCRRVFTNLTENAVKYSGASPLKIKIELFSCDGYNIIVFRDNGKGVRPELLPLLFDQFWRADSARKEGGNGTGLGLYIVKYIIELHGGDVSAENDSGLKITIRLPASKED